MTQLDQAAKTLPSTIQEAHSFLIALDLSATMKQVDLDAEPKGQAESAYRHFLLLVWQNRLGEGATKGPLVPSDIADIVWHEHLMFSGPYRQFCADFVGAPIDHRPNSDATTESAKLARREHTRQVHRSIPEHLRFVPVFIQEEVLRQGLFSDDYGICSDSCDCECGD